MSQASYCSECGVKNDAGAIFCGNCGSQVSGGTPTKTSQPMSTASQPVQSQPPQGYQQPPQGYQQPPQGYQQPQQGFNPSQGYQQPANIQGGYQQPRKDTGIGFLGTFFIPGFAHFYTNRVGEGVMYLILTIFLYMFIIGFLLHVGLFLTAGGVVKDYNRKLGYPE